MPIIGDDDIFTTTTTVFGYAACNWRHEGGVRGEPGLVISRVGLGPKFIFEVSALFQVIERYFINPTHWSYQFSALFSMPL